MNIENLNKIANLEKPLLIIMCGIQCSGKSTKAKELSELFNCEILSSDSIRKDDSSLSNDQVFKLLYDEMNNYLMQGKNVIIDATNITIKSRKQIFNNLKLQRDKISIICYIMNTKYEECKHRLIIRNEDLTSHYVPAEILERYIQSFEVPFYEEGWDLIELDNSNICVENSDYTLDCLLKEADNFNQQNKHHTLNLGDHMRSVKSNLIDINVNDYILLKAALYHDVGKLSTQTFKENDPNAHYYNHANKGAYILLSSCCVFDEKSRLIDLNKTLNWIFYINYHMHPFNWESAKSKTKWKNIFGDLKFNNLILFNECDIKGKQI